MQNKFVPIKGGANLTGDLIPKKEIKEFFEKRDKKIENFQNTIASILKERIIDNLQMMEPSKKASKKIDLKQMNIIDHDSPKAEQGTSLKVSGIKHSKNLRIIIDTPTDYAEANPYTNTKTVLNKEIMFGGNEMMAESISGKFNGYNDKPEHIQSKSNKTVSVARSSKFLNKSINPELVNSVVVLEDHVRPNKIDIIDIDNLTKRTNNSIDSLENLLISSKHSASSRKNAGILRETDRYQQITPTIKVSRVIPKDNYLKSDSERLIPAAPHFVPILKTRRSKKSDNNIKEKKLCINKQESNDSLNQKSSLKTSYKMGCKMKKFLGNENVDTLISQSDDNLETDIACNAKIYVYKDYSRSLRLTQIVYDSLSDEELDNNEDIKIILPSSLSIHPESNYVLYLNALVFIGLIFSLTYSSYEMTFNDDSNNQWVNVVSGTLIDLILLIEIASKFFIGFFHEEDIIFDLKYLAIRYTLFGECLLDSIVALPFNLMVLSSSLISSSLSINHFVKIYYFGAFRIFFIWGRWLRILGIFKLWKKIDFFIYKHLGFEEFGQHNKKILIGKFVFFFFLVFHILTCFWIFIGRNELKLSSGNWLQTFNLMDKSNLFQYFTSLNFNIATVLSVGYGDIVPVNTIERFYMIFYMFLSVHFYSFIISWMSSTVSEGSKIEELFIEKKEILDSILHEFSVPESFEKQLKKSLKFMRLNYVADKQALLNTLPEKLKNDLYRKIYENRIGELNFFEDTPEEFILFCNPRLQLVSLKKREVLISTGDIFIEMYMVNKGNLNFYLGPAYGSFKINTMGKGYHFGDINMFLNERSEYTIKSSSINTEIFTLKKAQYSELKMAFPTVIHFIIKKSIDNFTNLETCRNEALDYYDQYGNFQGFKHTILKRDYEQSIQQLEQEERRSLMKHCFNNTETHSNNASKNVTKVQMLTNLLKEENYEIRKSKQYNTSLVNTGTPFDFITNLHQSESPHKNSIASSLGLTHLNSLNLSKTLEIPNTGQRLSLQLSPDKIQSLMSPKKNPRNNAIWSSKYIKPKLVIVKKENYTSHRSKFAYSKQFYEDLRRGKYQKMKNLDDMAATLKVKRRIIIRIHKQFKEDEISFVSYYNIYNIVISNAASPSLFTSTDNYFSSLHLNQTQLTKRSKAQVSRYSTFVVLPGNHKDSDIDDHQDSNFSKGSFKIGDLDETAIRKCSLVDNAFISKLRLGNTPNLLRKRNTMSPMVNIKKTKDVNFKFVIPKSFSENILKPKCKSNNNLMTIQTTIDSTKRVMMYNNANLPSLEMSQAKKRVMSVDSLPHIKYFKKLTSKIDCKPNLRGTTARKTVALIRPPVSHPIISERSFQMESSLDKYSPELGASTGKSAVTDWKNFKKEVENKRQSDSLIRKKKELEKDKPVFDNVVRRKSIISREKQNDKQKFLGMNKDEMMKDFGRRIDNNAFFENNVNAFEGYLKDFIKTQKNEVTKKPAEHNIEGRRSTDKRMLKVEFKPTSEKKKGSVEYLSRYVKNSKDKNKL